MSKRYEEPNGCSCPSCGADAVPEDELEVVVPEDELDVVVPDDDDQEVAEVAAAADTVDPGNNIG